MAEKLGGLGILGAQTIGNSAKRGNQALDETPGHLFSSAEADDVISFLILSAEFFWDCLVLNSDLRVTLFLSHDEFHSIVCKEQENLARIRDILEKGDWTSRPVNT
ncbi:MAG TPA: hypothetical protein VNV43_06470 [Candidatus Acidoferrales bacterium]|nr:hypothetical protein [Candidatus Acidoferrales bacterium]